MCVCVCKKKMLQALYLYLKSNLIEIERQRQTAEQSLEANLRWAVFCKQIEVECNYISEQEVEQLPS